MSEVVRYLRGSKGASIPDLRGMAPRDLELVKPAEQKPRVTKLFYPETRVKYTSLLVQYTFLPVLYTSYPSNAHFSPSTSYSYEAFEPVVGHASRIVGE